MSTAPTPLATPSAADLAEIVSEVWASLLLPTEVVPVEPTHALDLLRAGATWSASIDVTGPEDRRVTAALPLAGAHHLTSHLLRAAALGIDPTPDDVADALGELVNIVGGNVKSLMPEPSRLGLPTAAPALASYDATGGCAVTTAWHGHPVVVTVHDPSAAALTRPSPTAYPLGALS